MMKFCQEPVITVRVQREGVGQPPTHGGFIRCRTPLDSVSAPTTNHTDECCELRGLEAQSPFKSVRTPEEIHSGLGLKNKFSFPWTRAVRTAEVGDGARGQKAGRGALKWPEVNLEFKQKGCWKL